MHDVELFTDVHVKSRGSVQYRNVDRPLYGLLFDVMGLVTFAQLSRQFYSRVMAVAITRFKIEFMSKINQIAKRYHDERYRTYTDKQLEMFERSMARVTPMTLAYFHEIPLLKWNLTVKFGSVYAYKKNVQANSTEVDRELKVTRQRMTQNIVVLDNLLRPHGYKCTI